MTKLFGCGEDMPEVELLEMLGMISHVVRQVERAADVSPATTSGTPSNLA